MEKKYPLVRIDKHKSFKIRLLVRSKGCVFRSPSQGLWCPEGSGSCLLPHLQKEAEEPLPRASGRSRPEPDTRKALNARRSPVSAAGRMRSPRPGPPPPPPALTSGLSTSSQSPDYLEGPSQPPSAVTLSQKDENASYVPNPPGRDTKAHLGFIIHSPSPQSLWWMMIHGE